jgi:hypothetical protein
LEAETMAEATDYETVREFENVNGHSVRITREPGPQGWYRVTIDGCEWMGELYPTLPKDEAAAIERCCAPKRRAGRAAAAARS